MNRSQITFILSLISSFSFAACSSSPDDASSVSSVDAGGASNDGGSSSSDGGSSPSDAGSRLADGGGSKGGDGGSAKLLATWGTVGAGLGSTCAIGTGGVYCWTWDGSHLSTPALVASTSTFENFVIGQYSASGTYLCGLDAAGNVTCNDSSVPAFSGSMIDMSGNDDGVICVVTNAGAVTCGGTVGDGSLGDSKYTSEKTVVTQTLPALAVQARSLEAGGCALLANGDVWGWGATWSSNTFPNSAATKITALGGSVASLATSAIGLETECAIMTSGVVRCFNDVGNWGTSPTDLAHLQGATSVTIGASRSACGLMSDGSVKCVDGHAVAVDPVLPEKVVEISGDQLFVVRTVSGAVYAFTVGAAPNFSLAPTKVVVP